MSAFDFALFRAAAILRHNNAEIARLREEEKVAEKAARESAAAAEQASLDRRRAAAQAERERLEARAAAIAAEAQAELARRRDAAREHNEALLAERQQRVAAANERQQKAMSLTRQRRSRVDWVEVTGDLTLAMRQESYERGATALAMRKTGLTFDQIGEHLGVTRERVRQIVQKAEKTRVAPVEHWFATANGLWGTPELTHHVRAHTMRRLAHSLTHIAYTPTKRDWLHIASRGAR